MKTETETETELKLLTTLSRILEAQLLIIFVPLLTSFLQKSLIMSRNAKPMMLSLRHWTDSM